MWYIKYFFTTGMTVKTAHDKTIVLLQKQCNIFKNKNDTFCSKKKETENNVYIATVYWHLILL
jgi:hypothetical protein